MDEVSQLKFQIEILKDWLAAAEQQVAVANIKIEQLNAFRLFHHASVADVVAIHKLYDTTNFLANNPFEPYIKAPEKSKFRLQEAVK